MDKTFAATLFKLEDHQTPQDKYEEELFKFKQFFVTKAVVPKLFLSKLNEYTRIHEAALTVYPEIQMSTFQIDSLAVSFEHCWTGDYNIHQKIRTHYKYHVMACTSVSELSVVVLNWMEAEQHYVRLYAGIFSSDEISEVIVSKEPNPMDILAEMRNLSNDEWHFLKTYRKELPELLQYELKRLTLLSHYLE